jgi:pimeloyl-ACP methyl ester carboxylesterase
VSFEEFPAFVPMGEDRLCAVVCAPEVSTSDMGVVLLTGGNYTRTHRNRMWVRTARQLAEAGVPSIRVDYHGVGDSTGRAVFDMESPFDADALAAADFLVTATGVSQLTFLATCFGGRTAMGAAAKHPKTAAVTIFPVPMLVPRVQKELPLRTRVRNRIRRWDWGEKLFARPAVRRMRSAAHARRTAPARMISPRFKQDVLEVLSRGEVQLIYGDKSDTIDDLHRLLAELDPVLTDDMRTRLHVDVLPDCAPESFRSIEIQDVAVENAVASVAARLERAGLTASGAGSPTGSTSSGLR